MNVNELSVVFANFPTHLYPMKVEFLSLKSGEVLRTNIIEGPQALKIPGFRELGAAEGEVEVRVTYGDGRVYYTGDDDA